MRKFLSVSALVAASALALTGCGSTATTSGSSSHSASTPDASSPATTPTGGPSANLGTGAITVWVDSNREPVIKPLAAKFKADTGITVNIVVKPNEAMKDQVKAAIPTGKGPDVFVGAHDWTGALVANGLIAPVELDTKAADFLDVAVKAFTYEGKTYGVPYSIENIALVRNTTLAPNPPKDFADMIATGQALVKAGKAKRAFDVQVDTGGDPFHMYPLQASFGATVFALNADGSYDFSKLGMCGPEGEAFAAKLSELGKQKIFDTSLTGDIAKNEFSTGKTPYMITGPWNLGDFKKNNVKYTIEAIPSLGGKPATPFVGVQGFFLSAKSHNTLAATKFLLDYIGSEQVQTDLFKAGHRAPANKAAYEAAESDPDVAAFGKVGQTGTPMPNSPAMDSVWKYWGNAEASIIKGGPTSAWKTMCTSIEKEIKK